MARINEKFGTRVYRRWLGTDPNVGGRVRNPCRNSFARRRRHAEKTGPDVPCNVMVRYSRDFCVVVFRGAANITAETYGIVENVGTAPGASGGRARGETGAATTRMIDSSSFRSRPRVLKDGLRPGRCYYDSVGASVSRDDPFTGPIDKTANVVTPRRRVYALSRRRDVRYLNSGRAW